MLQSANEKYNNYVSYMSQINSDSVSNMADRYTSAIYGARDVINARVASMVPKQVLKIYQNISKTYNRCVSLSIVCQLNLPPLANHCCCRPPGTGRLQVLGRPRTLDQRGPVPDGLDPGRGGKGNLGHQGHNSEPEKDHPDRVRSRARRDSGGNPPAYPRQVS